MASRRILRHTVVLRNYLGEVNDEAAYQTTILEKCYCPDSFGVSMSGNSTTNSHGRSPKDSAKLYIFDGKTVAKSEDGMIRSYCPYEQWINLPDKSGFWTINPEGDDQFGKDDVFFRITGFSHKVAGSRRMWHFEVNGQ